MLADDWIFHVTPPVAHFEPTRQPPCSNIFLTDVSKRCVTLVTPLATSIVVQPVIRNVDNIKKMNIALISKSI